MKTIRVTYTVLDEIRVPDEFEDDDISYALIDNWIADSNHLVSDMEWEEVIDE